MAWLIFLPNGQDWQYAGTVDAAGGWQPKVVKGGQTASSSPARPPRGRSWPTPAPAPAGTWQPTGSLGEATAESVASATVGAGGTVIAVGTTSGGTIGKQPVFVTASRGRGRPAGLADRHPRRCRPRTHGQRPGHGRRRTDRRRQRRRLPGGLAPGPGQRVVDAGLLAVGGVRLPGPVRADRRDARAGRLARRGRAGSGRAHLGGRHDMAAGAGPSPRTWPGRRAS